MSVEEATIEELAAFVGACADTACKQGIGALRGQIKASADQLIAGAIGEVVEGADPSYLRKKLETRADKMPQEDARKVRMFAEAVEALQLGRRPEDIRTICETWIKGA